MINKKTTNDIHVVCYETDEACLLKPASFMNYAQEIAGDSADNLGFGQNVLSPLNQAWVISRMKVQYLRHPRWKEDLKLISWHRGLDGLFYVRDYDLKDADGNTVVRATSSWIIFDLATRNIVRSEIATCEDSICDDVVFSDAAEHRDTVCQKIRIPKDVEMKPAGSHTVKYSDIDKNGHTNNVMYTVWAMDCLDFDHLIAHPVKEQEINFNREAMVGETVELTSGCTAEGVWYVEGTVGGQQSFVTKFTF